MTRLRTVTRLLALLILVLSFVGCIGNDVPVPPAILPEPTPAPPVICSIDPENLSVQVTFGKMEEQYKGIVVSGIGFLPEEEVTLQIEGQGPQHGVKIETLDYPVNENGTFAINEAVPLEDPKMDWQVRVIHSRGTACIEFHTERSEKER